VWVDVASGAANLSLVGTSAQLRHVSASSAIDIAGGGANALTIDNAYSSGSSIQLANLGSVLVQGNMAAQLGVDIAATNSITVQPFAASSADAQINASGSVKLDVSGAGTVNILAGANHGAKVSGNTGGGLPGCSTEAVCITAGGAGTINVTGNGNNAARIVSPSGQISLTTASGTLNLSAASAPATGDAVIVTGGGLMINGTSCNGCEPLQFGVDPLGNGVPQAGVLANNFYRKVFAVADSGSIAAAGGSIDLLANDSVETAERLTGVSGCHARLGHAVPGLAACGRDPAGGHFSGCVGCCGIRYLHGELQQLRGSRPQQLRHGHGELHESGHTCAASARTHPTCTDASGAHSTCTDAPSATRTDTSRTPCTSCTDTSCTDTSCTDTPCAHATRTNAPGTCPRILSLDNADGRPHRGLAAHRCLSRRDPEDRR
jgi:hypothetical protein